MAIAHDTATAPLGSGTGEIVGFHTPVGTPKGVTVLVTQDGSSADQVLSVMYGLVPMERKRFQQQTTGETGAAYSYFLGAEIPAGKQTVAVAVSGAANKVAVCCTVTATAAKTESAAANGTNSAGVSNPSFTLATPASVETVDYGCTHSGAQASGVAVGSGFTQIYEVSTGGGSSCASFERKTVNGAGGNITVSWTWSNDECAAAGIAIREAAEAKSETPPPGGGPAAGNAPTTIATVPVGGADAAGAKPTAKAVAPIGAADAGGFSPAAKSVSVIGGADAGGQKASAQVPATSGAADAQGVGPAAQAPSSVGDAIADGVAASASTAVGLGVATAAGTAPAEVESTSQTPTPGGAIADGASPIASAPSPIGDAGAAGSAPTASTPVGVGEASSGGQTPASAAQAVQGGALAGGTAPTEIESAGETTVPGGAQAGGTSPTASVAVPTDGAVCGSQSPTAAASCELGASIAGGREPVAVALEIAAQGGANAAGNGIGATLATGGGIAYAGGFPPEESIIEVAALIRQPVSGTVKQGQDGIVRTERRGEIIRGSR